MKKSKRIYDDKYLALMQKKCTTIYIVTLKKVSCNCIICNIIFGG